MFFLTRAGLIFQRGIQPALQGDDKKNQRDALRPWDCEQPPRRSAIVEFITPRTISLSAPLNVVGLIDRQLWSNRDVREQPQHARFSSSISFLISVDMDGGKTPPGANFYQLGLSSFSSWQV